MPAKVTIFTGVACVIASLLAAGCAPGPVTPAPDDALRDRVIGQYQRNLQATAIGDVQELSRPPSEVEQELRKDPNRFATVEQLGGPQSYDENRLYLGGDLVGRDPGSLPYSQFQDRLRLKRIERKGEAVGEVDEPVPADTPFNLYELRVARVTAVKAVYDRARQDNLNPNRPLTEAEQGLVDRYRDEIRRIDAVLDELETPKVYMTLQRAIQLGVRENLDLELARLIPAIADTQVTQAEAAFDAVFFVEANHSSLDTPQPAAASMDLEVFGSVNQDSTTLATGLRKVLTTGGQVSIQTEFGREFRDPSFFAVDSFRTANLSFSITQPLLRNFGAPVTRSQIALAKNARLDAVEDLRRNMLRVAADTESAYWRLVLARHRVLIQTRLLEVTIADRNLIRERLDIDATQVDLAEANSFVESRRADLIRLQNEVRLASDALKQLIQAEELPVAGEDLILPLDGPYDLPIQFNLLDAVTTALRHRPELQRALLDIKDASIRQRVADNQRLPDLNLTATIRINGIGETTVGQAYEPVTDADFIDYIIGIQFEVPVGNRQREAALQQRKLESQASVINYQRTARDVVLSVKDALRNVINAYSELGARRGARLAAAENMRGIRAQIEAGNPLTPPFIDLKLRREEALAQAETQEIVSLVDYNNAIARFYQAMGTLLDRNGIGFNDPLAEMADETWR